MPASTSPSAASGAASNAASTAAPTALQHLLQRAVLAVRGDDRALAHRFVSAVCSHFACGGLDQLAACAAALDPWEAQVSFGTAIRDGFGASPLARTPADPVRDLAVTLGLVIAERLVHELQPATAAAPADVTGLDDACLAAIVAAGWLNFGLALVWEPGRALPMPINLITDVAEQQLGVADAQQVLDMEVRCKASQLLRLEMPTGPGTVGARRALIDKLLREQGIKPVVALRVSDRSPATAPLPWAAPRARLQAELGVELFTYGTAPAQLQDADRRRWQDLADELQQLLAYLRGAYPQPMAAAAPAAAATRPAVFISYARKNAALFRAVYDQLRVLHGVAEVWGDVEELHTGDRWEAAIDDALNRCTIAVLLVSPEFIASKFITHRELPPLQQRAKLGQVTLYPVLARSIATAHVGWLAPLQIYSPNKALDLHTEAELAQVLADMVTDIAALIARQHPSTPT